MSTRPSPTPSPDPSADEIHAAAARLAGVVTRTPLRHSPGLSAIAGGPVYLKAEYEQQTGSFKLRGAFHRLARLPDEQRARGVVAASAGNHGLGVAFAARHFGVPATIFIPSSAPTIKRRGIERLGARVDATAAHYDAAMALAQRYAAETGTTFITPGSERDLLAGAATIALEIVEDLPEVAAVVSPVGSGGLVGGLGAFLRAVAPGVKIIGVNGDRSNAMVRSLAAGHIVDVPVDSTLADGLSGQIDAEGLRIGRAYLDDVLEVAEADIAHAIAWLARHEGAVVEGSGAVGVGAVLAGQLRASPPGAAARDDAARATGMAHALPTPAVFVITGANIDAERHADVLRRAVDGPTP